VSGVMCFVVAGNVFLLISDYVLWVKLNYLSVHFYHREFTDLNPLPLHCFSWWVMIFALHSTTLGMPYCIHAHHSG